MDLSAEDLSLGPPPVLQVDYLQNALLNVSADSASVIQQFFRFVRPKTDKDIR